MNTQIDIVLSPISTILPANPTLSPRAPSAAVARARVICAAVAAQMSDCEVAQTLVSQTSRLLPDDSAALLRSVTAACAAAGVEIAPTGSGRQNAADCGGRILTAMRREAERRFAAERSGGNSEMTAWAVKAILPGIVDVFLAVIDLMQDMNEYFMDKMVVALANVDFYFDVDHRHGQVKRVAGRAIKHGLLTPDEVSDVFDRWTLALMIAEARQCRVTQAASVRQSK